LKLLLVSSIAFIFAIKDLDVVVDSAGLALIFSARLQGDGAGGRCWQLEGEGEGVGAQLLQQALLQLGRVGLALDLGVDLLGAQVEILLEVEAHDLIFFTTITEGAHDLTEDLLGTVQVLLVQQNNSI
jgi:hypothetical protein